MFAFRLFIYLETRQPASQPARRVRQQPLDSHTAASESTSRETLVDWPERSPTIPPIAWAQKTDSTDSALGTQIQTRSQPRTSAGQRARANTNAAPQPISPSGRAGHNQLAPPPPPPPPVVLAGSPQLVLTSHKPAGVPFQIGSLRILGIVYKLKVRIFMLFFFFLSICPYLFVFLFVSPVSGIFRFLALGQLSFGPRPRSHQCAPIGLRSLDSL